MKLSIKKMPHNGMSQDEEHDCEQAVLRLLHLGLEINLAVAKHDREALHRLVDTARQTLQVLSCSANAFPPDEQETK